MANYKFTWKSALAYAILILALSILLYYYREAYLLVRGTIRFFVKRDNLLTFIGSFGSYAPIAFVGIQVLQVLIAPIPGELTGFVGGYFFGIGGGFLLSTVGLTVGSWLAFFISRRFGLPFVRRFVGKETMDKFDYLMEHKGALFSFIFFLIPGLPKDYFCYLLGLSPMHVMTFLVISTVGRIPGTLVLTLQGQAVRSEEYRVFFVVLGLALAAVVSTLIYRDQMEKWLHKNHRPKKKPGGGHS